MNQQARRVLLASTVGITLAAGLMHPLWQAEWSVMDDHGMLSVIGPTGRLPWSAVPAVIRNTEAGHPGEFSRYRPGTFVPQVLEAAIIGPRPGVWYAWRTVQFAVVLAAVWWVASAFVGAGLATLLTFYTTTHYYWRDSFAHLFVSENWASVWLAVFAIGAERLWHWRQRRSGTPTLPLVAVAVGGACAAATKENMLVLLPLYVVALFWTSQRARLRPAVWGALLVYALASAFVAGAVTIGLHRAGGIDLYGNSVGLAERVSLLWRPLPVALAAAWVVLMAAWRIAMRAGDDSLAAERRVEWGSLWRAALALSGMLTLVLISQFVFYNGQWPTRGARFDFPGRLVEIVLYVAAWHFGRRSAELWQWTRARRRAASAAFILALTGLSLRHPLDLLLGAEAQARSTHEVGDVRRRIAAMVAATPARPIVLLASVPGDAEPAVSIARQLRVVERVPNPLFLDARAVTADTSIVISSLWSQQLRALSATGGGGEPGRTRPPLGPWVRLVELRSAGAPAPLCVALHEYRPGEIVACPGDLP